VLVLDAVGDTGMITVVRLRGVLSTRFPSVVDRRVTDEPPGVVVVSSTVVTSALQAVAKASIYVMDNGAIKFLVDMEISSHKVLVIDWAFLSIDCFQYCYAYSD
jgi:hypothetical protein